jgi:hypothetical protein
MLLILDYWLLTANISLVAIEDFQHECFARWVIRIHPLPDLAKVFFVRNRSEEQPLYFNF